MEPSKEDALEGGGGVVGLRFGLGEPERANSIKRASNSKNWKEGCSELGFDALKHWLIATFADDDCLCPELVDFVLQQHLGFTAGYSLATHANLACLSAGVHERALYLPQHKSLRKGPIIANTTPSWLLAICIVS